MQCVRCGASFEGRFCPRCGMPAPSSSDGTTVIAQPAVRMWPCPRCGTPYVGNFCPRCGLPAAAWAVPPRSSAGRTVLSILWTLALAAFLVFAATDLAGLAVSPTLIVPGITGSRSGNTINSALDLQDGWTNHTWARPSTFSHETSGGNPGGYLKMTLFGSGARGYWMQAFEVDGSRPYRGSVRLDVEIGPGLTLGHLFVFVHSSNADPDPNGSAVAAVRFGGPAAWTPQGPFRVTATWLSGPGTYYLKVGFVANSTSGPVVVGLDNIRLTWTTDAAFVLWLPAPGPFVVFVSRDPALLLSYFVLLFAAVAAIGGYHLVRERRELWNAFKAPVDAVGTRLRARSAWIAVGQVWMAVTFVQVAVILLLPAFGIEPTSPIEITPANAWVILYELLNAGVYEEVIYRFLLVGVPMAVGSAVLRILEVNRGTAGHVPVPVSRYIAKSWRYLLGGVLRRDSPKEAHVAAWALLFASSAAFGLAHLSGWGWWKVFPSFVAGLGFGYLFLRHGLGAAILAHFVNDYALALTYEGIGGDGLEILLVLLFFGLTIAGAGFLAWYAIDAVRHLRALLAQFRPQREMPPPTRAAPPFGAPPPVPAVAFPEVQGGAPPAHPTWGAWPIPPPAASPAPSYRDPTRVPRDYTPSYVPPPYGYPPVRFQCPTCGWVEARYDDGHFTCTRCGRTA